MSPIAQKANIGTWVVGVLALVWLVAVALGQRTMLDYDFTPAQPGDPPAKWPSDSKIPRTAGLPTIVLLAHPRCPCTRATIDELARMMARLHNQVIAVVIFVRPQGLSEQWEKTDLWRDAARIPGVAVFSDGDGDGREA